MEPRKTGAPESIPADCTAGFFDPIHKAIEPLRFRAREWAILTVSLCVTGLLSSCALFSVWSKNEVSPQTVQEVFHLDCANCHGLEGHGDGQWHSNYSPPPTNLTLIRNTLSMNLSIARHGVPGTKMPGVPGVSPEFVEAVMEYLKTQPKDTTVQWERPWSVDIETVDLEFGRKIYLTACVGCHGPNGDGESRFSHNRYVWPKPANFRARNSDVGRLYFIISNGRPGTMMAPQKDRLSEEARWAAARYVESLFDPNSTAEIQIPEGGEPKRDNPRSANSKSAQREGMAAYELYCIACHGSEGKGTFIAPRLRDREWKYGGGTDTALFVVLEEGIPGKQMPSWRALPADTRWSLIALIRHWGGEPDPLLD